MENEMKKGNLVKGLRLLRKSNILSIVAVIVGIVGSIMLVIALFAGVEFVEKSGPVDSSIKIFGAIGIGGLIIIIGIILTIIAGIMGIVALVKAGGSHDGYQTALIFVIVGIAVSVASVFFFNTVIVSNILNIVSLALNFLVVYFVINATVALLRDKGDQTTADIGVSVRKLYIICTGVIIVFEILMICPFLTTIATVLSGIAMVGAIVQLVALFKYIAFLGKSATALEA